MEHPLYKKRVKNLRKNLGNKNPDMVWIVQPENRRYLSGFTAFDTQLNESSGSLFITHKKSMLITDSRYTVVAEREAPDFKVITQKGVFQDELIKQVERADGKTLGFEGDHVIFNLYSDLLKRFKKFPAPVKMKNISGMIEKMREIKDEAEISLMEKASLMMSKVLGQGY